MPLTCTCDWDPEPGDVLEYGPGDYEPFKKKRRKRCFSCHSLIGHGDLCCFFERTKIPGHDIELEIYGEDGEIPLADGVLCETCADLFFSLKELGFCVLPSENQRELLQDYHAL